MDVVAHSMGGLVSRALENFHYKTMANYYQGCISRLITIGTPHLGTPIASWLWSKMAFQCKLAMSRVGKPIDKGAIEAMIPGSDELNSLGSSSFKVYKISATDDTSATELALEGLINLCRDVIDYALKKKYFLDEIMETSLHDTIVTRDSQEAGGGGNIRRFTDIVHAKFVGSPVTETNSSSIMSEVKNLLLGDSNPFQTLSPQTQNKKYLIPSKSVTSNKSSTFVENSDEIVVTSPAVTDVDAGSTITVTVEPKTVTFSKVLFWDINNIIEDDVAPFSTTITVPDVYGTHSIAVIADDGTDRHTKIIVLNVTPSSDYTLDSISVSQTEIYFPGPGFKSSLRVKGLYWIGDYSDSMTVDLTSSSTGTTYAVSSSSSDTNEIISVSNEGLITALYKGTAVILITNSGKSDSVSVEVSNEADITVPYFTQWGMLIFTILILLSGLVMLRKKGVI